MASGVVLSRAARCTSRAPQDEQVQGLTSRAPTLATTCPAPHRRVEADDRVRGPLTDGLDVGRVQVHRDRLDLLDSTLGQCVEERAQRGGVLAGRAPHDGGRGVVADQGQVPVVLASGDLIDPDVHQPLLAAEPRSGRRYLCPPPPAGRPCGRSPPRSGSARPTSGRRSHRASTQEARAWPPSPTSLHRSTRTLWTALTMTPEATPAQARPPP